MPEGPEVWILSNAINQYYKEEVVDKTISIGKHLIVNDINEDWSFGLTGKVSITESNILTKIYSGWLYGDQISITDSYSSSSKKLGVDWLTSSKEDLEQEVFSWIMSKKKLAILLLDQSKICGIGVAWGSEILFKANLRPDIRACDQNLTNLVNIMIEVREQIKKVYENGLTNVIKTEKKCKEFINNWFLNLYEIREMNVYKKGSQVKIQGRNWWV